MLPFSIDIQSIFCIKFNDVIRHCSSFPKEDKAIFIQYCIDGLFQAMRIISIDTYDKSAFQILHSMYQRKEREWRKKRLWTISGTFVRL